MKPTELLQEHLKMRFEVIQSDWELGKLTQVEAAQISRARLKAKIGKTMRVLVDAIRDDGLVVARSSADAPEIDGLVFIQNPSASIAPGQFVEVKITDADEYDLYAELNPSL